MLAYSHCKWSIAEDWDKTEVIATAPRHAVRLHTVYFVCRSSTFRGRCWIDAFRVAKRRRGDQPNRREEP